MSHAASCDSMTALICQNINKKDLSCMYAYIHLNLFA